MKNAGAQTQKKWRPAGPPPEGWARRSGGPKGRGPEGWGPDQEKVRTPRVGARRVGAQNFALFSHSRSHFRSFSLSLGSSRGILVVFEAPGPWVWDWGGVTLHLLPPQTQSHRRPPRKNGGRSKVAQKSQVCMSRFLDTSSTTEVAKIVVKHRRSCGSSWTKYAWSPTCRPLVEKNNMKKFFGCRVGQSTELGLSVWSSKTRTILVGLRGPHQTGWKERRIWVPCGRNGWSWSFLENQPHSLTTCILDALNVNANRTRISRKNTETHWNHEFLQDLLRYYLGERNLTQKLSRGHTIWKVMRESALKDIVNWRLKRQSSCTKARP